MNFKKIFQILFNEFIKNKIDFALIGGHALNILNVSRATIDIDFIILLERADIIDEVMKKYGYICINKTIDVANYTSPFKEMGQVDFLFAHRKYALAMLKRAKYKKIFDFNVKVLNAEDLIGLKVQSSANDKQRYFQDMADIQELIKQNYKTIDLKIVREYFKLFGREDELDRILKDFTG